MNDIIFIGAGSGHIYGIDIKKDSIIWDFYIGSDLDGTITITKDNKLLCSVEKQFIKGNGGMLKIDPAKSSNQCVDWFFPTGDSPKADSLLNWEGGVIGSQAINDYIQDTMKHMVAFNALDGCLYVVSLNDTSGSGIDWNCKNIYAKPKSLLSKII